MLEHVAVGYGRAGLEALRRVVSRAKRDDPLDPVVVLVPNHIAGTTVRRYLAREGLEGCSGPGVAGLDVTMLPRLAERLAARTLSPRRPATRQVLAAAWRRVLRTDAGVFAETAEHPATVRALVAAHHELRDLAPAELEQVADAGDVSADLVRLHRQVVELLTPDWYDVTDLLHTAAERADRVDSPVVLYLPQDLSNAEASFIEALAAAREVVVLTGHTHQPRADEGPRARWPEAPTPQLATPSGATPSAATRVLNASDSDDEVRGVVRELVRALQDTEAHRIAVLYTAADPYAALLHDHLAAAGIRVNGPGARPVIDRALPRALLGLLDLGEDIPRAALFRTLSGAPLRDFTGERIPVSAWERVSREAGVVRGADWQVRLEAFLERQQGAHRRAREQDLDGRASAIERQISAAEDLRRFVLRLQDELRRAAELTTWADLATWCQDLVTTVIGAPTEASRLPLEEQYAATTVTTLLTGLEVLDEIESRASLAGLRDALDAELAEAIPRLGRFGDGILVGPLAQAIGLEADLVHVVGLSEDLYPGRPGGDSLLPDAVRTAVPSLRTVHQAQGTAYRRLLAAFAAAPEVVASFPRGDLRRSSRRLPSRWLLDTFRTRSGVPDLALSDWDRRGDLGGALVTSSSFSAELLRTPDPATPQEWRTRAVGAGQLDDPVVDAAATMLRARGGSAFTRFDGNLAGVDGLPDFRTGDRTISPTALEHYVACPHRYFMEHLLRVVPLDQPEDVLEISPLEIGNLVHHSFDLLVAESGDDLPPYGQPWSAHHRDRLVQILREQAAVLERTGLTGHPRLWQVERDRIEVDLTTMLTVDDEWRAEREARVAASEMSFGRDGQPPVVLPVAGGQVTLRGSADKVDVGRDGTVYVTDIKTGSSRTFSGINPEDPLAGATRFQLPAYGLAARARFGSADSVIHADYWFVRKTPGRIGLVIDDAVVDTLSRTVGQLTAFISQGHFPPRPPEAPDFAWVQCRFCNPDGIGHGAARERWERQRHDPALADFLRLAEPDAVRRDA